MCSGLFTNDISQENKKFSAHFTISVILASCSKLIENLCLINCDIIYERLHDNFQLSDFLS